MNGLRRKREPQTPKGAFEAIQNETNRKKI